MFQFRHELAVAAIMKNEGDYIEEWLEYHLSAGVTKFYLYDNESQDDFKEKLQPYIEKSIVDYVFFPGKRPQMPAYQAALTKHRFESRYMAFIDADEFIYPIDGKSIPECVGNILSQDEKAGGVAVNWRIFGSSGHEKKDLTQGVLKRFVHRGGTDETLKCIVNPRTVDFIQHPHGVSYYYGKYSIDEYGHKVFSGKNENGTTDRICVNHYHTKSKEEWITRKSGGDVYFANLPYVNPDGSMRMDAFESLDQNEIYDRSIIDYWECRKVKGIKERGLDETGWVIGCLNRIAEFVEREDTSLSMEEFLCYWNACNASMSDYLKPETVRHFDHILIQCLGKVLQNTKGVWEWQLFLSAVADIVKTHKEVRPLIVSYGRRVIPQLMGVYRMAGDYCWYHRLHECLKWVETLQFAG